MTAMSVRQKKAALRCETAAWQRAAFGLLVLSVTVNTALTARIATLVRQQQSAAAQYRQKLQQAEHIRDMAVQELGALTLRMAAEQEARAAQAAAYEDISGYRYIGECTITAYCCEPYEHICGTGDGLTATGLPVAPGMVAVDPEVVPLGSIVIIDGQRYLAADTGVTGKHIDIAVEGHQEALGMGVRAAEVWAIAP